MCNCRVCDGRVLRDAVSSYAVFFRKVYGVLGRLLKDVLIVKEGFSVCCNGALYAVCLGIYGRYAYFVRSLAGFSTPILEGIYVLHHVKGVVEMVILWVND